MCVSIDGACDGRMMGVCWCGGCVWGVFGACGVCVCWVCVVGGVGDVSGAGEGV